jgi:hypothetical protein
MTGIVLHIGGERTGTTSLQATLATNARALFASTGLLYPVGAPFFDDNGHFPLAAAFLDPSTCNFIRPGLRRPLPELRQALEALIAARRPKSLIFSAEHFSSRFDRRELGELARFFSPYPVTIVFYAREQVDLALSAFGSGLFNGESQWFHADAVQPEDRYFNHCLVADDWSAAFGAANIRVRPYDDTVEDWLARDFLLQAGLADPPRLEAAPRLNRAISIFEARLLQAINGGLANPDKTKPDSEPETHWANQALRERLLTILRENAVGAGSPSLHALIGSADREQIRRRFEGPNRLLAEKYGARISGRKEARPSAASGRGDPGPISAGIGEAIVALLGESEGGATPGRAAPGILAKTGLNFLRRALIRIRN